MMQVPASRRRKAGGQHAHKISAPKIIEHDIEKTVTELLEWDGWRTFKMEQNFSERKQKRTGEAGMPDRLYIRYRIDTITRDFVMKEYFEEGFYAFCQVLWIEFKGPNQQPRTEQLAWHAAERAQGALVLVVDSIESFRTWYAASGLRRR